MRKVLAALIVSFALAAAASAQQPSSTMTIVPDGNTQTTVTPSGNVTNVTTSTVSGNDAYNSFSIFNVNQNNVVNLFLPGGTDNLLNLVNSQAMNVDGILNSIKDGKIGGNVFFADPYGIIVGKTGVVNVGSFTGETPTLDFMNQFFTSPGNPSAVGTTAILNGTVPISPDGLISVVGTINATGDIALYGGAVSNSGIIQSGALFSGSSADFSDVVNTNGLQNGTSIAIQQNGNIVIQAAGDVENAGTIATDGGDNLNAGNISVQAGGNVNLDSSSVVSASGHGTNSNGGNINILAQGDGDLASGAVVEATGGDVSGNGGAIDISPKGTLRQEGGTFNAGATQGTAGSVTFDPTNIDLSGMNIDVGDITYSGDSITVEPDTTISSRQIASNGDPLTDPSTGGSYNLTFSAPTITVGDGANILANTVVPNVNTSSPYSPGSITFDASQNVADGVTPTVTTSITIGDNATILGGDISLSALPSIEGSPPPLGYSPLPELTATAQITIGNATISGSTVSITADSTATGNKTTNPIANAILNETSLGDFVNSYGPISYKAAISNSTITIGDAGSSGTATITGSDGVTIGSTADASTTSNVIGVSGYAYGETDSNATTTVAPTATISASGGSTIAINSASNNDLSVQESTTVSSPGVLAIANGHGISNSTTEIDGTVSGGIVQIGSTNTNSFVTKATGTSYSDSSSTAPAAGGGIAIAFGDYESAATTNVAGTVYSNDGNAKIFSNSTNSQNYTNSASSLATNGGFGSKFGQLTDVVQNFGTFVSQSSLFPSKAVSTGQTGKFGIAASVSWMNSTNVATTTVTGTVSSALDANITSAATDAPQVNALGSVSGQQMDFGGGLAYGDFSNTADTYVKGGAQVLSNGDTSITADATMANPAENRAQLIYDENNFSNTMSDVTSVLKDIGTFLTELGNPVGPFMTSFVNSSISTQANADGIQGSNVGIGGSIDILSLTNKANASVTDAGTSVSAGDLSPGYSGNVNIEANANADSFNVSGMGFQLSSYLSLQNGTDLTVNPNPGVRSGSSLGASFNIVNLTNHSTADIGDGASVSAESGGSNGGQVNVSSDTETFELGFGQAGDLAEKYGGSGTLNYLNIDDSSKAYIQHNAAVNATNDVNVDATNHLLDIAVGGALGLGGTGQINVTVNWNDINQTTLAYIGDPSHVSNGVAGHTVTAGGNLNVEANSREHLYAVTLAASSGGTPPPTATGATEAPSKNGAGGGGYGFGVSGEVAINGAGTAGSPGIVTKAFINNGSNVTATGQVNVQSNDSSQFVNAALAGTLTGSFGSVSETMGVKNGSALAGAYDQNTISKDVEAFVDNALITNGSGLDVEAKGTNDLYAVTAGGAVNTLGNGIALAGEVNNNAIYNTIKAYVGPGTLALSLGIGGVTVKAQEGADEIASAAGGIAIGANKSPAGVGSANDIGNYHNTVKALIYGDSIINTDGNIQVTSKTNAHYNPVAVSIAGGAKFGVSGSLAVESINDTTGSAINGSTVSAGENLLVGSQDSSGAQMVVGGVGIGGTLGVGVSALVPSFSRDTTASIGDGTNVSAPGSDTAAISYDGRNDVGILLDAKTTGDLFDIVANGSGSNGIALGGAIIVNPVGSKSLDDTTSATIGQNATVNGDKGDGNGANYGAVSDQSVSLHATDQSSIYDVAGMLAVSNAVGSFSPLHMGFGIGYDQITPKWTVSTSIGLGSVVNAAANVVLNSSLQNSILSVAISGSGTTGGIGGAGAASVIDENSNVDAQENGTVNAGGSVKVAADRNTAPPSTVSSVCSFCLNGITVLDGNASVSWGAGTAPGPGVGASVATITTNDTVDASISGTGDVTALGNWLLLAPNGQLDSDGFPVTSPFQGVSVTAISNSSVNPITAGVVAGSSYFAGQGSILNNSFTETTDAHIDPGAQVNVTGDSGANPYQNVQVLATDKTKLNSIAGGLAVSLTPPASVALTAAVDNETLNRTVDAYISGATVNASENVLVEGTTLGSITSTAVAGSVGGVSGTGAASAINETTDTEAYVSGAANVTATGSVGILADRNTTLHTQDGGVAAGKYVGLNGSVSTVTKNDTVSAYVGPSTHVTALGNFGLSVPVDNNGGLDTKTINGLSVVADATESLQTIAVGGAFSTGFSGAGSVTVNNVTENTSAEILGSAIINHTNDGASSDQGVNVLAYDKTTLTNGDGAVAAAFATGAGAGAAVDTGNIQKTTTAEIQNNAHVNALGAVNVDALSIETIKTYEAAVAGSLVAGLAGTDADYSKHPIVANTTAFVGTCPTSTGCGGGATVTAGSLGLDANDNLTLKAYTGELSAGGAALGGGVFKVTNNGQTQAYIGPQSNITTNPAGVTVNSTYSDNLTGTVLAGGSGGVAVYGVDATITDNHNNSATIKDGVTIDSSGPGQANVDVNANTTRNLSVTTGALGGGVAAGGAVTGNVTVNGATNAEVFDNANITAHNLIVSADDTGTVSASGTAIAAGIGAGGHNQSKTTYNGSVTASIGDNATINVSHDMSVTATGKDGATSSMTGGNYGGVTVGVDRSIAAASPTITASIGDNETINAAHNLSVKASYTSDGVVASGNMSAGSLINGQPSTSYSHANNSPTVKAIVGDSNNTSSWLSAAGVTNSDGSLNGGDITISSKSDTNAKATFNGASFTGVNIPGKTESIANINNTNQVSIGSNVDLSSGNDLLLSATTSNVIPKATVTGTNYGLFDIGSSSSSDGATAKACINSPGSCGYGGTPGVNSVMVDSGATLNAGQSAIAGPSASATLEALSSDSANDVNATSTVGDVVGTNNNFAYATVVDSPSVSVTGATIDAPTVTLEAEVNKMLVSATADSVTSAGDSTSSSTSTVNVTANPEVDLSGANISGPDQIAIDAIVSGDSTQVSTSSLAKANISGATGSLIANSTNNTTFKPTVNIGSDSVLTTDNLDVETTAPAPPSGGSDPYYSNSAIGDNNTAVSWVLTTTEETINQYLGWIPFVGNVMKQVTKTITTWTEVITNSTTNTTSSGNFTSAPSLTINATMYQSGGQGPSLTANPDGSGGVTFTTDGNISATASASDNNIVVDNLINQDVTPSITLDAPGGTVKGTLKVHHNTSWATVDITNNTDYNLVINDIQPTTSSSSSSPDVTVTAENSDGLNLDYLTDSNPPAIDIQNNSGSDITFDGFINNPAGSLDATNTGGNILGGSDNLFLVNQLSLTADVGSIGSSDQYLNAQMESDNASGASLSAQAGGDLFLNATLVQNVDNTYYGYTIPGALDITSISTGGDSNLNLEQPTALLNNVDQIGDLTISSENVNGSYCLDSLTAGGDATVNVTDIPEHIGGSFYLDSLTAGGDATVNVVSETDLYNGNIGGPFYLDSLTADGDASVDVTGVPLFLSGTLEAGHSAKITDTGNSIYNHGGGAQLVQATDINLSALDGGIGTHVSPINIDLTGGSVTASALESVYLNAPQGDLPVGSIDTTASNGTVNLNAFGSILDGDNSSDTDITAGHITLTAGDSIGTDSNALIVETPNVLNASSGKNMNLTQASGTFNIGEVSSSSGNVTLTALSGDVNLGTVNSEKGATAITASGSILDGDAAAGVSDINANSINLTATTGTIGTDANPLQINSSFSVAGLVNGEAADNVNLNEVAGTLNVGSITSDMGNVNLTALYGDVTLGTVSSNSGDTTITAGASILDPPVGQPNITAVNVNLTTQRGSIGSEGDPITIDASGDLTAGAHLGAFITESNGALNVDTVTSQTSDVGLTALSGDVNLGTVNSKVGTTKITASGSILDGDATAGVSDINAVSISLKAIGGTIGTDASPLQIDSSFSGQGVVNAQAEQGVYLDEVSGDLNVDSIKSRTGDIVLLSDGSILNFGTSDSNTPGVNLTGKNITLTSSNGSIGANGNLLTIDSSFSGQGVVNAQAEQGVYLDEVRGDLNVDSIKSRTGDIVLLSDGSILNFGTSDSNTPGVNLTGKNITLTSSNGSIGDSATRLVADNRNPSTGTDGSNYLDMTAQGDIYVEERGGNLLSHSISSNAGDIDLWVSNGNGNLDQLVGNQNVTVTVEGNLLDINNLTGSNATTQKMASPNNVSLTVATAGGTLNVNHMDVFQSVTTRADNTNLFDVVHTNLATPQLDTDVQADALHFDDSGSTGGIANNIDINVSPCVGCSAMPAVIFDNYLTQTGTVDASVEWLEFINTIVGTSADFQNNWLDIALNNIFAGSRKADTPWYLFMIGNSFAAQSTFAIEQPTITFLQPGVQPSYVQTIGTILNDVTASYGFHQ